MLDPESRLSPQEYAILVEQAPIMIWRAGTDSLCDYFNERWLAFTGRTLAQEQGHGWAEGVHPEDLQRCVDYYLDHFHRHAAFEMEYRLRRHDGTWRWIFDKGAPILDEDGAFRGFTGSCIDITERIEAQEALAKAQEKQIRTLRGLLPLCMMCRKIKNDRGYWEGLEQYIQENSGTDFSHGLCPDCFPGYVEKMKEEARVLQNSRGKIGGA